MPLEGRGGGGGVSPLVFIFSFSSQPCDCLLLRVPRTSTPLGGGLAKVPTGKRTRAVAFAYSIIHTRHPATCVLLQSFAEVNYRSRGIRSVHPLENLEVARLPGNSGCICTTPVL